MRTWMTIALALLAAPAGAQGQAQMNAEAAAAAKRADTAMTAQWRATHAAMKRRGIRHAAALLASQRAWIAFRDAQCRISGMEFDGGSLEPMARTQCVARVTQDRTRQLKDLMWQQ